MSEFTLTLLDPFGGAAGLARQWLLIDSRSGKSSFQVWQELDRIITMGFVSTFSGNPRFVAFDRLSGDGEGGTVPVGRVRPLTLEELKTQGWGDKEFDTGLLLAIDPNAEPTLAFLISIFDSLGPYWRSGGDDEVVLPEWILGLMRIDCRELWPDVQFIFRQDRLAASLEEKLAESLGSSVKVAELSSLANPEAVQARKRGRQVKTFGDVDAARIDTISGM